jgi:RNA polymerase sigma factor (sigma-70 family)
MKENLIQFPSPSTPELTPEQNLEITKGLPQAISMSRAFFNKILFGSIKNEHTLEDITSYATMGLINAVKSYKPEMGVPRKAYYKIKIRSAILDKTRPKNTKAPVHIINASDLSKEGDEMDFLENLPLNKESNESKLIREQIESHLHKLILKLKPKEIQFIKLYFFEEKSLAFIGTKLNVTEGRACQIKKKLLARLKVELEQIGIVSAI